MKQQEFSAKTVDLAIEEGLKTLNVERERAEVEILSAGGFLSKAKVRLTVKDTPGEKAQNFVESVLKLMSVSAFVELEEAASESVLTIVGADVSPLLSHNGESIDALQYLSSLVSNSGEEEYRRIVLDADDYRKNRQKRLESIADKMAEKAIKLGYRIKLDPMNPYERRVMHARLQANTEVSTHSEGIEPMRYLVITPKKTKAGAYESSNFFSDRPYKKEGRNESPSGKFGDKPYRKDGAPQGGGRFDNKNGRGGGRFDRDRNRGGAPRPAGDRPPRPNVSTGALITDKIAPTEEE